MATRLYFPFPRTSVGFSYGYDADWEKKGSSAGLLYKEGDSSPSGNLSVSFQSYGDLTNSDRAYLQWISRELVVGQTISGSQAWKAQMMVGVGNSGQTLYAALGIRVIGTGGVVRKVLAGVTRDTTPMPSGAGYAQNRSLSGTTPSGNYTTVAGDRIVIELGWAGAPTGYYQVYVYFGYPAGGFLPEDDTTINNISPQMGPWVELTSTLNFKYDHTASDTGQGNDSGTAFLASFDKTASQIGSGTETGAVAASITATQLGTGAEVGGSGDNLSATDTGSGSDSGIVGRSLFGTDSGAGSESGVTTASILSIQTGVGSETATVEKADAADIATTQFGVGTQSAVADASIVASEIGVGAETGVIYAITDWLAIEFGTGHECAHPANDSSAPAETGTGTELAISGPWVTDVGVGASTGLSDAAISFTETPTIIVTAVPGVLSDDVGAGAEAGSSVVNDPFSDTGAGADAGVVGASIIASDTGLGGDAAVLLADTLFEFAGTGSDAANAMGAFTASESAAGVDGLTMAHDPGQADSGGGIESASAVAGIFATDSGAATEAASVQQDHYAGDSGAGVELLDPTADGVHVRFVSELGSGSEHGVACTIGENWSMDVDIVASESASGADAGLQLFNASIADTGGGSDSLESGVAFVSAETGAGTDDGVLGYDPSASEYAAGVDAATLDISPNFDAVASETGIGFDVLALVGDYSASDAGAGVDAGGVGILSSQSGTGVDSATGVRTVAEPPESVTVNLFSVRTVQLVGSPRTVDLFSSPHTPAGQK